MFVLGDHQLVEGGKHEHHEHGRCKSCVEDELQEVLHVPSPYTVIDPGAVMIHLDIRVSCGEFYLTLNIQVPHSEQW